MSNPKYQGYLVIFQGKEFSIHASSYVRDLNIDGVNRIKLFLDGNIVAAFTGDEVGIISLENINQRKRLGSVE